MSERCQGLGKQTGECGGWKGGSIFSLHPTSTLTAQLVSVGYKFLFEERALLLLKKKTEKSKGEK